MSVKTEKYKSKKAMKRHEMTEGPAARLREYGTKKKVVAKKMGKKK